MNGNKKQKSDWKYIYLMILNYRQPYQELDPYQNALATKNIELTRISNRLDWIRKIRKETFLVEGEALPLDKKIFEPLDAFLDHILTIFSLIFSVFSFFPAATSPLPLDIKVCKVYTPALR